MLAAVTAILVWLPIQGRAQGGGGGRGNFNPEEMRARMMEGYKTALDVKDDEAWKAIEPRIQKVLDARRDVGFGGGMGMRGMMGGRRGGGGGDNADQGQNQNRRRNMGGQTNPAAQALQQAIDSNASPETIKAKLTAYRDDRKDKEAKLEAARADLKKILSVKQEAALVVAGVLE
jgi:hypothetical protein